MKDQLINKEFDIHMPEISVCPLSKDKLVYNKKTKEKLTKQKTNLDKKKTTCLYP